MHVLGPQVSAAEFTDRDKADEAWGMLVDAGIPAAIITDPGMLGAYELSVMVQREDLERARRILFPLVE
ncbi:MAG: hypothetical protein BMS9Abin12_1613 [Acidimicrobiia bacterium]|nr:MAG: hypothetical protein BMS9Abin12_1613 [Acidimicrobiia bacterium]